MSTFSPSLRIELITTGDQAGTWGSTTNTNLGTLVESAITGYVSVSITSANQALTALDGAADESRNMTIALTTTTAAVFNVYAPPAEKTYIIQNASAYAATIFNSTVLGNTTAAGAGVVIPAGRTVTVWSDGANFRAQNDHLPSLTLATDLAVADGGTGASDAATARTNLDVPSRSGANASGTWGINISGNAATATTATTATSPASGGSFITSSNIGGQSVAFATNATNAANATNAINASFATNATNASNASNANTVSSVSTTQVLNAISLASIGAVGTYAVLYLSRSSSDATPGVSVAGSDLKLSSSIADTGSSPTGSSLDISNTTNYTLPVSVSGTWMCLCFTQRVIVTSGSGFTNFRYHPGLFLRIA